MDNYEKRLLNGYYTLWRESDALESAMDRSDEFKQKVGEEQFELIKQELCAINSLKDILEKRINNLNLLKKANSEGWQSYDSSFNDDDYLDREKVLSKACHDCYREMYAKSQPPGDYEEYLRQYRAGELRDDDNDRVYNRHYLSKEEYDYIMDKYVDAYGMKEKWSEYVDIVKSYFDVGAIKDKYIEEYTDDDGDFHTGYRSYEHLPHFSDTVSEMLKPYVENDNERNAVARQIYDSVVDRIETCKNFYRFDREESGFHVTIGLGASPTCNKQSVIDYWKERGVDVNIEDRNPDTFWEKDMYGDDYENDYEDVECEEIEDSE